MGQKNMGEIICYYRKEKGLTQKQLAEKIGVTNKAISKWETGDGYPDIMLIPSLAEALGISADRLFGIENKEELESTEGGVDENASRMEEENEYHKENDKQSKVTNRTRIWQAVLIYAVMMTIGGIIELLLNQIGGCYFELQIVGISILAATGVVAYK